MASNKRRSSGGRGRNRGGGAYARPISEPANFMEVDSLLRISGSTVQNSLTHAQVLALLTAVVPVVNISKVRISSVAFEPIVSPVSKVTGSVQFGITGNEYLWSNTDRPLKVRLGKDYGDDGMWLVLDGAAPTDASLPGPETLTDTFVSLDVPAIVTDWSCRIHVRFAFQDPS